MAIPHCNYSFLIEALLNNKRVDGRKFYQSRDLQVNFGQKYGTCYVQLGNTVMFASTDATVEEPRITRPAEGRFRVMLNITAGGKERWLKQIERSQPKESVLTIRLLEKIINRINVLDLESLCLVTGKSVWCVCTKLILLNYDGNLIEAASIATIASLMHFKRPDATVTPEQDIIIHSLDERNPIPLTLYHYPVCVTFQFMDQSHLKRILKENQEILAKENEMKIQKAQKLIICDPTEEEENFLKNVLVICANTYKEIVAIQSVGRISLVSFSDQLLKFCTNNAFERVIFVTNYLKACLDKHNNSRGSTSSFSRYNFLEAMKNGDLCIVKDYNRQTISITNEDSQAIKFEDEVEHPNNNDTWTSGDENEDDDKIKVENEQMNRIEKQQKILKEPDSYNKPPPPSSVQNTWAKTVGEPKIQQQTFKKTIESNKNTVEVFVNTNTKKNQPNQNNKNEKWTKIDKKKAATKTDMNSQIEKLKEQKRQEQLKKNNRKRQGLTEEDSSDEDKVMTWTSEFKKK